MPRPKPFVALYGQVDFDKMISADDISGTDIFVCRQGADGDNVFATASQLNDFFGAPDPLLLNDGTALAPSYSFASSPSTGFFLNAPDELSITLGGIDRFIWSVNVFRGVNATSGLILNETATATNPVISFQGDLDTGLGLSALDQLSLIAGGVQVANLTEAAGVVQLVVPLQDNAAFPSIAFGDGDTGFYQPANNVIAASIGGAKIWTFDVQGFRVELANGPSILNENTSSTNPTLIPRRSDTDTGIGSSAANNLAFIAGGLKCMSVSESAGARQIGFYEGSPISLQTGVAVTTAAVHAALVNLRLITA